jgi:mannose-1-phosphate guanylyltransferase/mannose-6-phosphate isomerase
MIRPVILSGGGGTRLWPLSRSDNAKQFHRLFGDRSLLQATALRARGQIFDAPLILTAEDQRFFVMQQLEEIAVMPAAVVLEPAARNTAPAIAAAAHWALARGNDDPVLVMPSDHFIVDVEALHATIEAALSAALDGYLLTFGIKPDQPKTGYGYIKAGEPTHGDEGVRRIDAFIEKPKAAVATAFLDHGGYFWNSGMFLFRPSAYLAELEAHAPNVASQVEVAMRAAAAEELLVRPEAAAYEAAPSISIDYAVMEHSDKVLMAPASFDWSDVGGWDAIHELMRADAQGNVLRGDVLALEVSNSMIRSDTEMAVAAVGLDGMLCVVAEDAVLVAPLDRAQDVKAAVDKLRARGDRRADESAVVHRPWGSYQTTDRGEQFQTKRLIVNPGARLSLQKHRHRSEHWVVVDGTAEVTVGDETRILRENESTFIPAGALHRLANPGTTPLHVVEVQCGSYLGEDDIVRVEDVYGRS